MSEKKLPRYGVTIIKASDERPVKKSNKSEQLDAREELSAADWISPPIDLTGLKELETESSILPQCIRAYKNNIAGFGIGIISWCSKENNKDFNAKIRKVKKAWLSKHFPYAEEIHIVAYGVPKWSLVRPENRANTVLFDDEEQNLTA